MATIIEDVLCPMDSSCLSSGGDRVCLVRGTPGSKWILENITCVCCTSQL
jgi:hypothetical protein